jgi:hypothetical protein
MIVDQCIAGYFDGGEGDFHRGDLGNGIATVTTALAVTHG